MKRNRIVYFIIGVVFLIIGYVIRIMNALLSMESSFIFIAIGVYFLLAVILRKASAWVLILVDLAIIGGLQALTITHMACLEWYREFCLKTEIGHIVIGGPLSSRIAIYIVMGIALGAIIELLMRQYNKIGLGD